MLRFGFFTFSFLLSVALSGQQIDLPDSPRKNRFFSEMGGQKIIDMAQDERGVIATIGKEKRGHNGGEDISFMLLDEALNPWRKIHIGRDGEDRGSRVINRPEGGFLVAGFSERPSKRSPKRRLYNGRKDAWLLWLNEEGDTESELILGTPDDDEWVEAFPLPEGGWILAGNSHMEAWLLQLDVGGQIAWQYKWQIKNRPTKVTSGLLSWDGHFYLTGEIMGPSEKQWWVGKFTLSGQAVWQQVISPERGNESVGIVPLGRNTVAVGGNMLYNKYRSDGFIAVIDRDGRMLQHQIIGGRDRDQIRSISSLNYQEVLIAGESYSFQRGARRPKAWLLAFNTDTQKAEETYYGGSLADGAVRLLKLQNGKWLMGGYSIPEILRQQQSWVCELGEIDSEVSGHINVSGLEPEFGTPVFTHPPGRPDLEKSFFPIRLPGNGWKDLTSLEASVKEGKGESNEIISRVPQITNCPYWSGVAIRKQQLQNNKSLVLQLSVGKENFGVSHTFKLGERSAGMSTLSLDIEKLDTIGLLGTSHILSVKITNNDNLLAENTVLEIHSSEEVDMPQRYDLGALLPGEYRLLNIPYIIRQQASAKEKIGLTLKTASNSGVVTKEASLRVVSALNLGSSRDSLYLQAVWVSPNPDEYDRELVWRKPEIQLQLRVVSSHTLETAQYCFEINGRPCQTGIKMDEVQLKGSRKSRTVTYQAPLDEGVNEVLATITNGAGKSSTLPLKIIYAPSKPNLHLLSIGVPSYDLKYTTVDARDIATYFTKNAAKNKAFQHVFVDTLASWELTTKTAILKSLKRYQYRHRNDQIRENDLLVVFISSHGITGADGGFRIAASDYDGPFIQETSLDFNKELVGYLSMIPCQKLFIIDACHSGSTSEETRRKWSAGTRQMVNWVTNNSFPINLLLSCQPEEYSYEDQKWKNGAFTESLIEGLSLFYASPEKLDQNMDRKLNIKELFDYVKDRTPSLVSRKKPKTRTSQTPSLYLPAESFIPAIIELPQN